jgi:oligopeptide transport system substrate-binding protein
LDPTCPCDTGSTFFIKELFSGLVEVTEDMEIVPDIAFRWEILESGKKYVFHLREDVYWTDGVPVTVQDFIYTWLKSLDPTSASPAAVGLDDIKGAEPYRRGEITDPDSVGLRAINDHTLIVELEEPAGYFLNFLANNYPVPRHKVLELGDAWADPQNIVTNGPFQIENWQPDGHVVLSRNPHYHGHFPGNLERFETTLTSNLSNIEYLELYKADQVDGTTLYTGVGELSEVEHAMQKYAGEYLTGPRLMTYSIGFNRNNPPFDDRRVRQAFVHVIDRDHLANVILRGFQIPATGGFVPRGMPGYSENISLPYDPDRAQELLIDAGFPGGEGFPPTKLLAPITFRTIIDYLLTHWNQILGVEITAELFEWNSFLTQYRKAPPALFWTPWGAYYPDPDYFLRIGIAGMPFLHQDDKYWQLVEEARRSLEQERRLVLYQQADRILIDQAVVMPLYYGKVHRLLKPWINKFNISPIVGSSLKYIVIEPH